MNNTNNNTKIKTRVRPGSGPDSSVPSEPKRGWVLAGNPDHLPSVPLPAPGEVAVLVRSVRARRAYTPKKPGKYQHRTMEMTIPADVVRFMALEEGMELLVSMYADGRVMLTRAGVFVGGEETRDL